MDGQIHARMHALMNGFLLGTFSQESVSTQQVLENFNRINLILSLLAPFI